VTDATWSVRFARRAEKDIDRLDPHIRDRVIAAIDRLLANDLSLDLRRLATSSEERIRVGDWRVRFARDVDTRTIVIQRVLPRERAYDR
jgi:mRNA-degrading endonuclease RelE of RelBE toxin-antitoxin system